MLQGKKELAAVDSTELNDENDNLNGSESEDTPMDDQEDSASDIDSDEEQRRYDSDPCNVINILIENDHENILLCANTQSSLYCILISKYK